MGAVGGPNISPPTRTSTGGDDDFGGRPVDVVFKYAGSNGNGDPGTDADIEAFFACLAGNCCPTCGTADFNHDGDVATDADIEAFFRVLAGGSC